MILFRNVYLSRGKSTTRFGVSPFSEEKRQFSLDVKQKHTFYKRKSTKKIAKVSPSNNNYSIRTILPFNNNKSWRTSRWMLGDGHHDGLTRCNTVQQQTDQDLWKVSAVSAVAVAAEMFENEPSILSRCQRSGARSNGVKYPNSM